MDTTTIVVKIGCIVWTNIAFLNVKLSFMDTCPIYLQCRNGSTLDFGEVSHNSLSDMGGQVQNNKKQLMAVLTVKMLIIVFEKYVMTFLV